MGSVAVNPWMELSWIQQSHLFWQRMSPAKKQMAVWEKQQSSDGCSILQNYRLTGKPPSTAFNLHTVLCTPHLSLMDQIRGFLWTECCQENRGHYKHWDSCFFSWTSLELKLPNLQCLAPVPISALCATQREMGVKKKWNHLFSHGNSFWNTTTSSCVSWNGINNYIEPAPCPQLSMVKPEAHTKHFPHIHSLYSTMTSSCPVNCILHYSEWLYTIKSLRRAKMGSKTWKWQT